ncbi:hypothetical protein EYF80_001690 [Liparis tanakae]|uniref:Uncharacterized protein n=1 Tax=Liparis tanakae TaxID=230148 RepID=A0A4Z2JD10_9TELE|nr:hypothetical protein EYF80_001690 [Liparis tanakae]
MTITLPLNLSYPGTGQANGFSSPPFMHMELRMDSELMALSVLLRKYKQTVKRIFSTNTPVVPVGVLLRKEEEGVMGGVTGGVRLPLVCRGGVAVLFLDTPPVRDRDSLGAAFFFRVSCSRRAASVMNLVAPSGGGEGGTPSVKPMTRQPDGGRGEEEEEAEEKGGIWVMPSTRKDTRGDKSDRRLEPRTAPHRTAPHRACTRKHTRRVRAALAVKPLPGRNASCTYETSAALGVEQPLQGE